MSASRFRKLVSSFEQKYGNSDQKDDYVVDITTMNVVDNGRRQLRSRQSVQRKSSPVKFRPSSSSNVEYVCPPGFESGGQQMAIYRPPANSEIYNGEYQVKGLQEMYNILLNDDKNGEFRDLLIQKAFKTLGLKTLPASDTVHPFIHISDEGTPNITFLYDSPPFTPWKAYIECMYPKAAVTLSKQIYECLLNPMVKRIQRTSSMGRNNPAIMNGSFESESSESDDIIEQEYMPVANPASRRTSQRARRVPKKLLTTNIEAVFDPSDISSIEDGEEFVMAKPKRKSTAPIKTVEKKPRTESASKRVYTRQPSTVTRTRSSTSKKQ